MSLQIDGFDFLVFHGLEYKPNHFNVIALKSGRGIGLFPIHGFCHNHAAKQLADDILLNLFLAILALIKQN